MSAQKGAPTHLPRSLTAGRQAGLSIASWGGREGPLPIELHLLHPAFCSCYQKPPPPALSCPSRTRSKASTRALFTGGSAGLSMNKLELPAEFMPVPCPLADKSPIGFWIRQGAGDGPGQLPAFQPRGPRSRQQFTALRLNCLPCRNG